MPGSFNRRGMIKSAAALAAASTLPRWFLEESHSALARTMGPNDKPGIALIGCGGRGTGVAREAAQHGNLIAYCDVTEAHRDQAKKNWPDAVAFSDFRKLLERKDIDIIVNGTP